MLSIKETFRIYTGYPGQLSRILGFVSSIDSQLGTLRASLKQPAPFVLILVNGFRVEKRETKRSESLDHGFPEQEEYITDKPVTMAVSAYAPHTFNFQPDVPIGNPQIGIICDVQRVRIDQIVAANQHLSPTIEGGPFAYADGIVGPWNRITIVTSLR